MKGFSIIKPSVMPGWEVRKLLCESIFDDDSVALVIITHRAEVIVVKKAVKPLAK